MLDQYEILDLVGHGSFAWVYRARSRAGEEVAVKVHHSAEPTSGLRFAREIKVLKALPPNPVVVKYIDQGIAPDGLPLLVMEYVDGISLRTGMERCPRLPPGKAVAFMAELCQAFDGLHQLGVAHRDVKPENILLARQGGIKLIDLGLIKDAQGFLKLLEQEDPLERSLFHHEIDQSIIVGTPEYMAPEQFSDSKIDDLAKARTDTWSDVFSLGVILYQLLSGKKPFPMPDVDEKTFAREFLKYMQRRLMPTDEMVPNCPGIDASLNSILRVALRHDPRRRQADARVLANDLIRYLETGKGVTQTEDLRTVVGSPNMILQLSEESGPVSSELPTSRFIRKPDVTAPDDEDTHETSPPRGSQSEGLLGKRHTVVFFTPNEAAEPEDSSTTIEADPPGRGMRSLDAELSVASALTRVDTFYDDADEWREITPTTPQLSVDPATFTDTTKTPIAAADTNGTPALTREQTERQEIAEWIEGEVECVDDTATESLTERIPCLTESQERVVDETGPTLIDDPLTNELDTLDVMSVEDDM